MSDLINPNNELQQIKFQTIGAENQVIDKIMTVDKKRNKIILIQPADTSLYQSALNEAGSNWYVTVIAHGTANTVQGLRNGIEVKKVIEQSGVWQSGQWIVFDACRTGARYDPEVRIDGCIASLAASTLHTYVTAPTTQTWNYPLGGGAVGQGAYSVLPGIFKGIPIPNYSSPGDWVTFGPNGQATGSTRNSPRDNGQLLPHSIARRLTRY
jgi:hypothetical protein